MTKEYLNSLKAELANEDRHSERGLKQASYRMYSSLWYAIRAIDPSLVRLVKLGHFPRHLQGGKEKRYIPKLTLDMIKSGKLDRLALSRGLSSGHLFLIKRILRKGNY